MSSIKESIVVRAAAADDVPAMSRLRRAWTDEDAGEHVEDDTFEERFAHWLRRDAGERLSWLVLAGGEAVGMLNLAVFHRMPRPGRAPMWWGYIANVYVLEAWRSGGVGTQLLDAAVTYAREHRFVRLVLSPSERSVPFYGRAGFVRADELLILDLAEG